MFDSVSQLIFYLSRIYPIACGSCGSVFRVEVTECHMVMVVMLPRLSVLYRPHSNSDYSNIVTHVAVFSSARLEGKIYKQINRQTDRYIKVQKIFNKYKHKDYRLTVILLVSIMNNLSLSHTIIRKTTYFVFFLAAQED